MSATKEVMQELMSQAIVQAQLASLNQDMNPHVGAILVNEKNEVVATGFHRGSGTAHAEVDALSKVADTTGLTLYTTMEPCNAVGKQGPCSHAIVAAGIKKVVIGQPDLNPTMLGGAHYLTEHGVEVTSGVLSDECAKLNESWNFAITNNRPWVIWKIATSLDAYIAAADGTSKWITDQPARSAVQDLRATVGAIVTGTGTALADDPELTVRNVELANQPLRVVLGNRQLPKTAKLLLGDNPAIQISQDASTALTQLWTKFGVHKVLVEAGPGLSKSLWQAGLVDEVYWFQAPLILGSGIHAIGDFGISTLDAGRRFSDYAVNRVGLDLLIHFRTNQGN
jgi:diaminohydroxyphosphoribosylaminopyrimidine deaminase/5-amino-6-(5-phosphoribosylamino)uracil reductase